MKVHRLLEVNLNFRLSNIKLKRIYVEFFGISTVQYE